MAAKARRSTVSVTYLRAKNDIPLMNAKKAGNGLPKI